MYVCYEFIKLKFSLIKILSTAIHAVRIYGLLNNFPECVRYTVGSVFFLTMFTYTTRVYVALQAKCWQYLLLSFAAYITFTRSVRPAVFPPSVADFRAERNRSPGIPRALSYTASPPINFTYS